MKRREILRNPVFPKDMDDETIKLLTQLCFSHQDTIIGPIITALMIFGTSVREHHYACSLLFGDLVKRTAIRNVYLTGGSCTDGLEAYLMAHRIGVKNYPLVVFKYDDASTNTLENVRTAVARGIGKDHRHIAFMAKWGHCGRARLTLKKHLPQEAILYQCGYPHIFSPIPGLITPETWHLENEWRSLIWGEFLRIETYGKRGDIYYPSEVSDKVRRIRELMDTNSQEHAAA